MNLNFLWKNAILVVTCFEVLIILSTAASEDASVNSSSPCQEGWERYGEFCIILQKQPVYFRQASANCVSMGGNLASIHSAAQNDLYANLALNGGVKLLWIGLSKHNSDNILKWEDGTLVDYTRFQRTSSPITTKQIGRRRREVYGGYLRHPDFRKKGHFRIRRMSHIRSLQCIKLNIQSKGSSWKRSSCSDTEAYLCQRKLAESRITSTDFSDENEATIITRAEVVGKHVTTTITSTDVHDETATSITSTNEDNKTEAATVITSAEVKDATANTATLHTRTDADVKTAISTMNNFQVSNRAAPSTNFTDVDVKTVAKIIVTTTEPDTVTVNYSSTEQDDKNGLFSFKTFIIIFSVIILFIALVGGIVYCKRSWLEKNPSKVFTVFFRRFKTANEPSSSFVLNKRGKSNGSKNKYITRYISFRNEV